MEKELSVLLVSTNLGICEEWEEAFKNHKKIKVICERFQQIKEYDCITSPANSFGLMDGGMDLALIDYFGEEVEKRVREYIVQHYSGIQPVGTSFIIPTHHPRHPFLAHSPTMMIPKSIDDTMNVYLATKATLESVYQHNQKEEDKEQNKGKDKEQETSKKIKSIILPAFGGGTGEMHPKHLALQMKLAYEHVHRPERNISWGKAYHIYNRLEKLT